MDGGRSSPKITWLRKVIEKSWKRHTTDVIKMCSFMCSIAEIRTQRVCNNPAFIIGLQHAHVKHTRNINLPQWTPPNHALFTHAWMTKLWYIQQLRWRFSSLKTFTKALAQTGSKDILLSRWIRGTHTCSRKRRQSCYKRCSYIIVKQQMQEWGCNHSGEVKNKEHRRKAIECLCCKT